MVVVMVHMGNVMVVMNDCRVLKDLDRGRLLLVRRCPIGARVRGGPSACCCSCPSAHADVDAVDFGFIASCCLILGVLSCGCGCQRDELLCRALVCR